MGLPAALSALLGLGACLKDHPLLLPGNAYDPALALRTDSLARFDSVEILLVDPGDPARAIPIFRGSLASGDVLSPLAAGDGPALVYLVRGWKAGRGQCFTQRVSRDGTVEAELDTCAAAVPPETPPPETPTGGRLRGRAVSARDGSPEAGWTVRLSPAGNPRTFGNTSVTGAAKGTGNMKETETARITDADGRFDFGRVAPGAWELAFDGAGRIGRTLRVGIEDGDSASIPEVAVLPAAELREAPLAWSRNVAAVAVAAGQVVAPSSEFEAPGAVATFPLDNLSPALQRFPGQGNGSVGNPQEFYEAGDVVADPAAAYIAYPESHRLGKVGYRQEASAAFTAPAGLQPSALILEGGVLLALGRLPDGTLALGAYDTSSLALLRLDTLSGHVWDGMLALERGPRIVAGGEAWYAVDGNGPAVKGRLLRIDKETREARSRELPEAQASDLVLSGGRVLVTFAGASARHVRAYGLDLEPIDSLDLGYPAYRIAAAGSGRLEGYAFVATADNAVTVIEAVPGARWNAVGRLALGARPRGLAVEAASASLVVTDGRKVLLAGF